MAVPAPISSNSAASCTKLLGPLNTHELSSTIAPVTTRPLSFLGTFSHSSRFLHYHDYTLLSHFPAFVSSLLSGSAPR